MKQIDLLTACHDQLIADEHQAVAKESAALDNLLAAIKSKDKTAVKKAEAAYRAAQAESGKAHENAFACFQKIQNHYKGEIDRLGREIAEGQAKFDKILRSI